MFRICRDLESAQGTLEIPVALIRQAKIVAAQFERGDR